MLRLVPSSYFVLPAGAAMACSEMRDIFKNLLVTHADCSFTNADSEPGSFGRDQLSGGKVYNRGEGRVAQRVTYGGGCSTYEWLVFTECDTGEAIAISGKSVESLIAGWSFASVAEIQPPNGPIRADGTDNVKKLAAQAKENDLFSEIKTESDGKPNGFVTFGLWRKYAANCGCKKFYPGSAGAKN